MVWSKPALSLAPGCSAKEVAAFRRRVRKAKRDVHPWIDPLLGADRDAVRESFRARWAEVEEPCLVKLRDYLLSGEVTEICVESKRAHKGTYVHVVLPTAQRYDVSRRKRELEVIPRSLAKPRAKESCCEAWFLSPPPSPRAVKKALSEYEVDSKSPFAFASFLRHFSGLAEDIERSGSFCLPGELALASEYLDLSEFSEEDADTWGEALTIYNARNGNVVLLQRETGAVGFAIVPQERRVQLVAKSFPGFVDFFIHYARKYRGYPFDGYGP